MGALPPTVDVRLVEGRGAAIVRPAEPGTFEVALLLSEQPDPAWESLLEEIAAGLPFGVCVASATLTGSERLPAVRFQAEATDVDTVAAAIERLVADVNARRATLADETELEENDQRSRRADREREADAIRARLEATRPGGR